MIPYTVCPATCELCGNWLPNHQSSCPRNGVHPSQWSISSFIKQEIDQEEQDEEYDEEEEL
ncbi:hypothetical protein RMATCC62417_09061 [Rhizopus microsporus]|nr:hypothetical protein RMATCC62417_09061 [Rhizopus microsporus]